MLMVVCQQHDGKALLDKLELAKRRAIPTNIIRELTEKYGMTDADFRLLADDAHAQIIYHLVDWMNDHGFSIR